MNLIINYELEELKNALFATIFEEEADFKTSINTLSDKIDQIMSEVKGIKEKINN